MVKFPTKYIEELKSKGWELKGKLKGLPILQHPNGTEAILDTASKKLIPRSRADEFVQKAIKARLVAKQARKRNKQIKNIVSFIQKDADERNLGLIDFSPQNWFSYARGYKTPKESITYYEEKFLPQLQETYNKLVNNNMLYYDPTSKKVMGIIDGKPVPLKRTEDKLAYIVTNTPNGDKLYFNGEVASTGVPAKYKESFIRQGGNPDKPNWANTNLGAASYYAGKNGLIGIFTTVIPKLIGKYIKVPKNRKIPEQPILIEPGNVHPTSNQFIGQNPITNYISDDNYAITEITRPIKDDIASQHLNTDIITKMRTIGQKLPLKALLGNSGEFDMKNPNPFKVILPIALTSGGIYGATKGRTADKEGNQGIYI